MGFAAREKGGTELMPVNTETDGEVVTETVKAATKKNTDTDGVGVSVYVGPYILGVIQSMTIYPCSRADALKRDDVQIATARYPLIATLIVPAEDLAQARIDVKTPGTALYKNYREISKAK
jgi:hypothetical protein